MRGEQAIVVDGHGHILCSVYIEGLQGSEVGGCFDQDAVSGIDEELPDQVESLLRTRRDQHILSLGKDPVAGHAVGDHLPQRLVAFGGAVLQGLSAVLRQHFVAGFLESLYRENIGRRQATGEGNDLRTLGNF